jgi:ATP-dependent Lhr-like helicase
LKELNTFDYFSPPLIKALEERGFSEPTDPQMKLVPLVLEGKNDLLMAPTGTGKTEAAFLPILDVMIRGSMSRTRGTKLLYITPLRALNRDMLERMQWWCKRFDIRLGVRHGDTPSNERTNLSYAPPDILITTPETLQAVLTGRRLRDNLSTLRWVVVDEVHELAEDKRGSQLSVALERLRRIVKEPIHVIGLSATVGSPETVAEFLVGKGRECEIVRVPVEKSLSLRVVSPKATEEDLVLSEKIYSFPEAVARLRLVKETVEEYKTVLVFTNTRSEAEALANRFRVWDPNLPIGIHHSSLSRSTREAVERNLKDRKLQGVICTSSLELGIDIGFLEFVIQYNSPRQVSRLIQRVGRSGHKIREVSKGMIITQDSDDTLEAMVLCKRAFQGGLEPLEPFKAPYDAAIHQVAGLLIEGGSWKTDDLYNFLRKSYAYSTLSVEKLRTILSYMRDRYPRLAFYNEAEGTIGRARDIKPLFDYYFENLSMIPDEKQYLVMADGDTMVGVLDEAFVSEYGEVGVKFVEAGRCWKIKQIYENKVYVSPEEDPSGAVPSWVGDEIPVPLEVALEVGTVRRRYAEALEKAAGEELIGQLCAEYPVSDPTLREALREVAEQHSQGVPVPSDILVTIERWDRYVIIQTSFGHKVNRVLARVIGYLLSERIGQAVAVHQDPYRIIIEADVSSSAVESTLRDLHSADLEQLAKRAVERSGIFKRRLIHAGKKCGAIGKEADFASVSIAGLIEALRDTPVFEEAMNVIFHDDFDINSTKRLLEKFKNREISVATLEQPGLSPIARIGMEEISRRGEVVSPERLRSLIRQSTSARVLDTFLVAVCTKNWDFIELRRVRDLETLEVCPKCGEKAIGFSTDSYETVFSLAMKARSRSTLHGRNLKLLTKLQKSAEGRNEIGFDLPVLMAGRGIRLVDALNLGAKKKKTGGDVVDYLIEGEKEALMRRYFSSPRQN